MINRSLELASLSIRSLFLIETKMNPTYLTRVKSLLTLFRRVLKRVQHLEQNQEVAQKFYGKQTGYMTERIRITAQVLVLNCGQIDQYLTLITPAVVQNMIYVIIHKVTATTTTDNKVFILLQ